MRPISVLLVFLTFTLLGCLGHYGLGLLIGLHYPNVPKANYDDYFWYMLTAWLPIYMIIGALGVLLWGERYWSKKGDS